MKILALDQATKCGYAHSDGQSGVWDISVHKDESSGMRLIRLRNKLNEFIGMVDLVAFEASRNLKYGHAVRVAAEIQGTITTWCIDNNVEYVGISPNVIKKHATRSGNASKKQMLDAAIKKWPDKALFSDDEADALWLLDYTETLFQERLEPCAKEGQWKKAKKAKGDIGGT